jgi:hypothetical protein
MLLDKLANDGKLFQKIKTVRRLLLSFGQVITGAMHYLVNTFSPVITGETSYTLPRQAM